MPKGPHTFPCSNPFCAARLRPGTIDFIFKQGEDVEKLVDALETNGWQGQITGPHGTGKSTLLAALSAAIEARGRMVYAVVIVAGQRRVPRDFAASLRIASSRGVAAVDGFEQLGFWNRLLFKRHCRTLKSGLLVASHRSAGLPDLYQTAVDERMAWQVVQQLQAGFPSRIEVVDVAVRLAHRQGNLREALFDLYDLYEARKSQDPSGSLHN